MALQGGQAAIPPFAHVVEPCRGVAQSARHDPVANIATVALACQETRTGQGIQVFHHGLAGDGIAARQLGGGQGTLAGNLIEQASPGRVSQRGKDGVDLMR